MTACQLQIAFMLCAQTQLAYLVDTMGIRSPGLRPSSDSQPPRVETIHNPIQFSGASHIEQNKNVFRTVSMIERAQKVPDVSDRMFYTCSCCGNFPPVWSPDNNIYKGYILFCECAVAIFGRTAKCRIAWRNNTSRLYVCEGTKRINVM